MIAVAIAGRGLVAFDFRPAGLFANRADAQADLLFFHVHLDDLEVVLLALLQRQRMTLRIHCFGNMAKTLDSLGNFDKGSELRGPQNLAVNHVANAVLGEESLPDIRLQLLHAQREAAILRLNAENNSL